MKTLTVYYLNWENELKTKVFQDDDRLSHNETPEESAERLATEGMWLDTSSRSKAFIPSHRILKVEVE